MEAENSNELSQKIDELTDLFKKISVDLLKKHSQINELMVVDYNKPFLIHGHWMTLMHFSTNDFKLIFKNYFYSKDIAEFAFQAYKKSPSEIEPREFFDFSKEYCNLFCGEMKWYFEQKGCVAEQSLPLLLRSFDQLFFLKKEYFKTFHKMWGINHLNYQMIHSLTFEVYNKDWFQRLNVDQNYTNPNRGVFEIL